MIWFDIKTLLHEVTRLDRDALHIYLALAGQLAVVRLFGWKLSQWRPLGPVLLFELLNEAADLWHEQWPDKALQYGASLHDVVNTMAAPLLLMLVARRLTRGTPSAVGPGEVPAGR